MHSLALLLLVVADVAKPAIVSEPARPPVPSAAVVDVVSVAAASDLRFALDELVARYEKANPSVDVRVTYGSSGLFFAQLTEGAPFDVYLSADSDYPKKLVASGVCRKDSLFPYAIGRIVVWAPKGSKVNVARDGAQALVDGSVKKVAIANPKHAPYGRAAEAMMRHFKLYEAVSPKLVLGENISQTAQMIESGAADIGVIALSLALSPAMKDKGTWWTVPTDAHPPIAQAGCVVAKSTAKHASAVRDMLLDKAGRELMSAFGFLAP